MADAQNGAGAPTILSTTGGNALAPSSSPAPQPDPSAAPLAGGSPSPVAAGTLPQDVWNGDPSRLPAELQPIYKSLYGDYQKKTTEYSTKSREMEAKLQQVERQLGSYAQQEQRWREWQPTLNRLADPQVWARVQPFVTGQAAPSDLQGKAAGETPQQALERLIEGGADDDFISIKQVNDAWGKQRQGLQREIMGQAEQQMRQYAQEIMQQWATWNQNYQTLADQARGLELRHRYGLEPKAGTEFSLERITDTARRMGITDLDAAYRLTYGEADTQRAIDAQMAHQAQTMEQARAEAYERGKREGSLASHNSQNSFLPPAALPKFQNGPTANNYREAEQVFAEKLAKLGVRG